ncbi:penicillin-binding protein 1A [Dysgonomonas capnocytophagoides]|uniref:Penicillin-binding protein 1A n=1 Tax=Dysgonomonas capnocytophagoides TaxID=45254 RepID=A0A4Y8L8D8_9BACT|nr:biosynthetic peptidoglycan transglycosylase [Dysgonomonas capnocytophagoides]TFD97330.1 penicillin-binding protein 1A [Dysgonomonas capnocytophagoides]
MNNREQYFPTYTFNDRDILLIEFEKAYQIANGQTKIYGQLTNILIAICAIIIPLFLDGIEDYQKFMILKKYSIELSTIIIVSGALLLRYFVDLQIQITINARKAVTLRTMLGLNYGNIQLTLPNWRVEGASNPFTLKLFNGWFSFQAIPFVVLTLTSNLIWYLSTNGKELWDIKLFADNTLYIPWWIGNVLITIIYLYIFRTNLNDRHESNYLNIVKIISKILNIKLLKNIEYIIYRAKLSYIEIERLNVDYSVLTKYLVEIEEHNFYNNSKGYSIRSLLRGVLSQFPYFRKKWSLIKSGGSTITMQLVRTLFIPSNQNEYKRKILEILLSPWISKQFSKKEILKLYVASVQYERGINGLISAIKYFFASNIENKELTKEESFFLVERLSNITSTYNFERINMLLKRISFSIDKNEIEKIYNEMREKNILSEIVS